MLPTFPAIAPYCHRADFSSRLSGGSGDAVPVFDARALYRKLVRAHVPAELRVYPHGTHQWKGAQRVAAERWIDAFLQRYLFRG